MESYGYSPLEDDLSEIRVLKLLPGEFGSPIIISITTVALRELGGENSFPEALSYVWGSINQCQDIVVEEDNGQIVLMHGHFGSMLFASTQQDLEERSRQIRLMGQIYSSATRVIVWMGPKSEDSDLAIDLITTLALRVKVDFQTSQLSPITDEVHWADHNEALRISDGGHSALFRFYSRSWFGRIWVWQEVHLATDVLVLCGNRSIGWDSVKTGVVCLGLKPRPGMTGWPAPEAAFSMATFSMTKNYPLRALLHKTKDSRCFDARDKIYALLSFLDEDMRARIVPNYKVSTEEVYRQVMLQHFATNHLDGPRLLSTVEMRNEVPDSPSWVPRWDLPRLSTRFYHSKSALETLPCIKHHSRTVIEATGVYVSEINKVEHINIKSEDRQQEIIVEFRRLRDKILPGPDQDLLPLVETLTANYIAERHYPTYAWRPGANDLSEFSEFMTESNDTHAFSPSVDRVIKNIQEFGPGRALCTTVAGRLCLGPIGTRPGDILIVLLGCDSPLVLHPLMPGSEQYCVIGEAFCHGFMQGEALLGPLPNDWRLVIRHVRTSIADSPAYWNVISRRFAVEDPRLGDLPKGWGRKAHDEQDFQTLFVRDGNGQSSETWEDPRMARQELLVRGVLLKTFQLV